MLRKNIIFGFILIAVMLLVANPAFSQTLKAQNLRGMDITIGNWYEDFDVNTFKPQSDADEQLLDWRRKITRENNFTMREKNIASWNEMPQLAATSIMAGRPAAQVFVLQGDWAMGLMRQRLLFPIGQRRDFNWESPRPVARGARAPEWNQSTRTSFTFNNTIYAFSNGVNLNNAAVVFFNKRLFREAGLDPNLPYDLQKNGQWTWERFLQICKQLTRDTRNTGVIDTYALPRDLSTEIMDAIVSSNGAMYVDRNRQGKLVNATNRPEFLAALQYLNRLLAENVMKPRPANSNWDWYKNEFKDGRVAMRIEESYVWNELGDMRDDWGVVMFPKGPNGPRAAGAYNVFTRENIMIIPSSIPAADVDKILYAVNLWFTPVTDDWKSGWYNTFRDRRAVDETLAIIRDTRNHIPKYHIYVPGLNRGGIAYEMFYPQEGDVTDPAQVVEKVSQQWNALIEDANDF